MPVTATELAMLKRIFRNFETTPFGWRGKPNKIDTEERLAIAKIIYNSFIHANIPMGTLMTLGRCLAAKVEWKDLPPEIDTKVGDMKLALVKVVDEFLIPEMPKAFGLIAKKRKKPINDRARKINPQSRKSKRPKTERSRKRK